jgi:hypothetical protein
VPGYRPEDRALFEEGAIALYDAIARAGGIDADDPRLADEAPERSAFDLLVRLNLVRLEDDTWQVAEPATAQSQIVAPLSSEAARLLAESARWSQAFQSLNHSWRAAPHGTDTGPITYLYREAIDPYLDTLINDCQEELLTAQPQVMRDAGMMAAASVRDAAALERGISMRTLYQHSARRSTASQRYVSIVTPLGAEVRTLDEFFDRMILIDRTVAVIPGADGPAAAVVVRDPAVVRFLVDTFERAWERARPFTTSDETTVRQIAEEQRSMTIRMLIEGHSDANSARRMGVSPRTYAGYVADLRAEYNAATRFQLGYTMGRLGIAGTEADED